ncbi:MAG TPA: DUF2461 domain-containing protein [Draconibacterium sp.]|nr:DUF2461 domain-containing protein [Draconibacterium sp.]
MENVLQFLKDLALNNNREWFNDNRRRYEESRNKILFITELIIHEIHKFDPDVPIMNPKDCMFRIFRDIRFSKDKRPYKTNFGAFIAKGGRKSKYAGYYIHIEPGMSFAGGGIYMPPADSLKAIRMQIDQHPHEFVQIISDDQFQSWFAEMFDHKLKTAPKGFPKDHKYIEWLKYKSYAFSTPLKDNVVTDEKFLGYTLDAFRQLYKINSFLNQAVKNNEGNI